MGGLCTSAPQQVNSGGPRTIKEAPMMTLEDFAQDQQQYVGQLARLTSQSAKHIEGPLAAKKVNLSSAQRMQVDPILAQEFVETAKAIKVKQHQLMKQIINLGTLLDMSIASLQGIVARMTQAGQQGSERCKSFRKQVEAIERGAEKLQNLKNKVKKLDPNQESLNNIKVRMSTSQLNLNVMDSSSARSQNDLRKMMTVAGSSNRDPDSTRDSAAAVDMDLDQEELEGKIQEYLRKLNEILTDYERQRVIESAVINIERFNSMLQAFMDLPETEQLLKSVKNEGDQERYCILTDAIQHEIIDLENQISDNQADTTVLFVKLDAVERLTDSLTHQTLLSSIAEKKGENKQNLVRKVSLSHLQQVCESKLQELSQLEHQVDVVLMSNPDSTEKIQLAQSAIKDGLSVYKQLSEKEESIDEITDALFK